MMIDPAEEETAQGRAAWPSGKPTGIPQDRTGSCEMRGDGGRRGPEGIVNCPSNLSQGSPEPLGHGRIRESLYLASRGQAMQSGSIDLHNHCTTR